MGRMPASISNCWVDDGANRCLTWPLHLTSLICPQIDPSRCAGRSPGSIGSRLLANRTRSLSSYSKSPLKGSCFSTGESLHRYSTSSREIGSGSGGEARDYATLCAAARRLPTTPFVLIARPDSLNGIDVPANVLVHTNLPWDRAWSIVWHAELVALPLRSKDTPNGHVTAVGAMHLGKAQVITDSAGIRDYFVDGQTALLVHPQDPAAFARSIDAFKTIEHYE